MVQVVPSPTKLQLQHTWSLRGSQGCRDSFKPSTYHSSSWSVPRLVWQVWWRISIQSPRWSISHQLFWNMPGALAMQSMKASSKCLCGRWRTIPTPLLTTLCQMWEWGLLKYTRHLWSELLQCQQLTWILSFMREWARDHGKPMKQMSVRQLSTMDKPGTLVISAYQTPLSVIHLEHAAVTPAVHVDVEMDDDESEPKEAEMLSCTVRRVQRRKTQMSQILFLILMTYRRRLHCHCWLTLDLVELFDLCFGLTYKVDQTKHNVSKTETSDRSEIRIYIDFTVKQRQKKDLGQFYWQGQNFTDTDKWA